MPLINVPNVQIEQSVLEQALIDAGVTLPQPPPDQEPTPATTSARVTFRDVKGASEHGGSFNSGGWRRRDLNEMSANSFGATLAGNQFTLPAGTYVLRAVAPAYQVVRHKIRLFNVSANAPVGAESPAEVGASTVAVTTKAELNIEFTLAESSVLEIQHTCYSTKNTTGFGAATSPLDGTQSVYTQVFVEKVS